jgi:hypothetical protein
MLRLAHDRAATSEAVQFIRQKLVDIRIGAEQSYRFTDARFGTGIDLMGFEPPGMP